MKYYIIAGEASGDLHGSNLIKALKEKDDSAEFRVWGGGRMEACGATIAKHYRDISYMGFFEVAANIFTILGNFRFCKKDILEHKPDIVILIDYPGFNLRMLNFLKKHNFRVVYYISPQLWAWNKSRVKLIKKYVDLLLVILPFEEDFYQQFNVQAHFVGHPLLDAMPEADLTRSTESRKIALLPGSRPQEIQLMLPEMLKVTDDFPDYQFIIAGMDHLGEDFYRELAGNKPVQIIMNKTYDVLVDSEAAIVTSGTATLEAALLGVPQVVVYKGNRISYWIGRKLVKVPYISLVNLILESKVVDELIQHEFNQHSLTQALNRILQEEEKEKILLAYQQLYKKLGGKGASENAASKIKEYFYT